MDELLNQEQQPQEQPSSTSEEAQAAPPAQEGSTPKESVTAQDVEASGETDDNALLTQENATLKAKLLDTKIHAIAASLKVQDTRIPFVMKLAVFDGIDVMQDGSDAEITQAIQEVLAQIPEWKQEEAKPVGGTGSVGAFRRDMGFGNHSSASSDIASQFRQGMR